MTGEEYAKGKRREQWRAYYYRNREARIAAQREWRAKNPDKVRAYRRKYYQRQKERDENE